MRSRTITMALPTADPDGICQSQTPGAAGALTINGALATGGVATLSSANATQRRVRITCAGSDAGRTFTITGTAAKDMSGNTYPVVSTMAGSAGTTTDSAIDYTTVTSVVVDAATAGAVIVGTNDLGSAPWQIPSLDMAGPFAIGMGIVITGTLNVDIEHTFDRIPASIAANADAPSVFNHTDLAGETASGDGNYAFPIMGFRATINSGSGTLKWNWLQAGMIGGN